MADFEAFLPFREAAERWAARNPGWSVGVNLLSLARPAERLRIEVWKGDRAAAVDVRRGAACGGGSVADGYELYAALDRLRDGLTGA